MRAIFMGTPEFAVHSLDTLVNKGVQVELVITRMDKRQGRKMKLEPPAVKKRALALNLPIYQPQSVKSDEAVQKISEIKPDLIVVTAYGQIIPKSILDIPRLGVINVHASLLPKYRGASPINSAILNAEKVTGITTMYVQEGLDTGDIILKDEIDIEPEDTAVTLGEKLAKLSEKTLGNTLNLLELDANVNRIPQDESQSSYCTLIDKKMGHIDFSQDCKKIINQIRAYQPWPCAYTYVDGKNMKIYKAHDTGIRSVQPPATVTSSDKQLTIATGTNDISIMTLQIAGKNRMDVSDFLRGNKIQVGTVLE